ncbi:cytochrome P450 family protein [Pleurotus pulmonarius]
MTWSIVLLTFSFFSFVATVHSLWKYHRSKYPPGPTPFPFIGNILNFGRETPWVTVSQWAKQYGDLVHVTVFGRHVVLANSLSVASELFERRSRIYSDRPELTMLTMMGWDFNLAFKHYDDPLWKRHRKVFQRFFGNRSPISIQPIQEEQAQELLRQLADTPDLFFLHTRNYAASIIMHAVCGHEIIQKNSYLIKLATDAVDTLSEEVFFGAQVLFAFPSLKHIPEWFPGGAFKSLARETRQVTSTLQNIPVDLVKKSTASGSTITCLTTELLELPDSKSEDALDESDIKALTATAFAGGIHTVESPLKTFFLAMVLYPQAQQRGQAEIDRVIGLGRFPTFQDQASLPYINAICKEILRWHPSVPLGVAHSLVAEDEYKGYYIPKDTTVLGNIWAMSRDERVYSAPDLFIPERFLNSDGTLNDGDSSFVFGFGRRACPGRHMAEATIFMAVASVLSVYRISKAKDAHGQDVQVKEEYSSTGLITGPLPFKCSISPRSEEARTLLNNIS